jgi:glutamate formiminotransferase / 5-formyltetrahydrofolate cyclo-ligase
LYTDYTEARPDLVDVTGDKPLLECVVNVSEGCNPEVLAALSAAAGPCLLDRHSDCAHHRSVFTLAGSESVVMDAVQDLAREAVKLLDLRGHVGAHPRFGVVDVVPWVALEGWPLRDAQGSGAERGLTARDAFAQWAASELGLPTFLYGPGRLLPEVRREAWRTLQPDFGPRGPHPTAGSVAVGARRLMVAYNLWLEEADLAKARAIAAALRSAEVRALAFALGERVQVSCNLVGPFVVGPAQVFDAVESIAPVADAELVGLVPQAVLAATPKWRWEELDLAVERTIEARLQSLTARHA